MNLRRVTPASVLTAAALVVVLFVLLMPKPTEEGGVGLDSRSMGLGGARGLYNTLARLRYPVRRDSARFAGTLSPNATYVILAPAIPLTIEETNAVLDAVRHGATVFVTLGRGALDDSLGFSPGRELPALATIEDTRVIGGPVPRIHSPYAPMPILGSVEVGDSVTSVQTTAFMWYAASDSGASVDAIMLGRPFGRGHAIAVAPAVVLTNQLLRTGPPAIAFVRALEWAHASGPVIFDEYHHGAGVHANPLGATIDALTDTPLGRAALMALAAALVLLMSVASRPIAPVEAGTVQRRSPLEHVQALARAYLQTGAGHLGAERLLRGLRRRHPLGLPRGVSDRVYLETVRVRFPAAAADARVLADALERTADTRITPARDAVASIEQILRTAA